MEEERAPAPKFLWQLFLDLRKRRFPLGASDYEDLLTLLRLGFGLESDEAFLELLCTLWAKSKRETDAIRALARQFLQDHWKLEDLKPFPTTEGQPPESGAPPELIQSPVQPSLEPSHVTLMQGGKLPPIYSESIGLLPPHLTLVPRFPLSYREVAQTWRRLRKPLRFGPRVEIDLDATIRQAIRVGYLTGPVLIPARRNTSRLLLLVDSLGSMNPFHLFIREIVEAIISATTFNRAGVFFFHDVMIEGSSVLDGVAPDEFVSPSELRPEIVHPLDVGYLYAHEALLQPVPIAYIYESYATEANVVILSDAGAARANFDYQRLIDTIACIKHLRAYTHRIVWLNPVPKKKWEGTTAAEIARHVLMFPIDLAGMNNAVVALKAERFEVE